MTPAAVVPMHTPEEAIEEATYAVRELGLKVVMIANHVRRPVPAAAALVADPLTHGRMYIDSLGFESAYDYDPFWRACLDLKVAVTAHSGSMGWHGRESVDSFTFNHIGHFANASHAFARALILGGVTHRFPDLRFAFLEGGVGWACNLVTRPRRALGAAAPRGDGGADAPDQCRSPGAGPALPPVRRAPVRGEDRGDLPLHRPPRALQDAGGADGRGPTGSPPSTTSGGCR